jgi:hypothetical protein
MAAAGLALSPPQLSLASWTDAEYATGSYAAGSVLPPAALQCSAGVLTNVTFTWSTPSGLTPSSYTWAVTGAFTDGGTTTSTSATLHSGVLAIGTATFSVITNVGTWKSTAVTGTVHVIGVLTPVSTSCSVP